MIEHRLIPALLRERADSLTSKMYFAAWAIQIPSIMARNRHFRTSAYQFFLPALNRFEYLLNDFRAGAEMLSWSNWSFPKYLAPAAGQPSLREVTIPHTNY